MPPPLPDLGLFGDGTVTLTPVGWRELPLHGGCTDGVTAEVRDLALGLRVVGRCLPTPGPI